MKLRVPTLESVESVAENVPKLCKQLFNIELDFSVDSVELLGKVIDSFPQAESSEMIEKLNEPLVAIGCYVGEVIRRNFGGKWQDTSTVNGFPIGIKLGSTYLNPVDKIIRRYKEGSEHNLTDYVRFAALMKVTFETTE